MAKLWEKLISFGLIHEPIGSVMFDDWSKALASISEISLARGIELSSKFTGFLKIGDFREMCKGQDACHKQYIALPHKHMEKDEIKSRLKKMRAELGI